MQQSLCFRFRTPKSHAVPWQDRQHLIAVQRHRRTRRTSAAAAAARSLHWFKITERIEYKLPSLAYKVLTATQPSYLHNLITVQPPRSTRSSSLITLARPSTSSSVRITDRVPSTMLPLVSGTNSRLLSVNHALVSPMLTHRVLRVALPPSIPSTHHSYHPSPLHSFIPGLKPSFSVNPSHRTFLFLYRTDSTDYPDCFPILLSISIFLLFSFSVFRVLDLVPCGRLSWLMSAFDRTLQ